MPRTVRLQVRARFAIGCLAMAVAILVAYLSLERTGWGQSLDVDSYFGSVVDKRAIARFDNSILRFLTPASALGLLAVLCLIAARRGILRVGVFLSATVLAAWFGAEMIKRLAPWPKLIAADDDLPANLQTMTAPSGHTTAFTALALAFAVVAPQRWWRFTSLAAAFVSAAVGLAVVIAGWHRASDAIIGVCWAGFVVGSSLFAMTYSSWFSADFDRVPRTRGAGFSGKWAVAAIGIAACQLLAVLVLAVLAPESGPDADVPYVALSAVTIACSYIVCQFLVASAAMMRWQTRRRGERQSRTRPPH